MLELKVFYNIPQDDRCEVIFTEQAIDIPRIRVLPLLLFNHALECGHMRLTNKAT